MILIRSCENCSRRFVAEVGGAFGTPEVCPDCGQKAWFMLAVLAIFVGAVWYATWRLGA